MDLTKQCKSSLTTIKYQRNIYLKISEAEGLVMIWAIHTENFLKDANDAYPRLGADSNLSNIAHEWWIEVKEASNGKSVRSWKDLNHTLACRFGTLKKEEMERDKQASWLASGHYISMFNDNTWNIFLDFPSISKLEQIDCYTKFLKNSIWNELCTRKNKALFNAMNDARRVEAIQPHVFLPTFSSTNEPETTTREKLLSVWKFKINN